METIALCAHVSYDIYRLSRRGGNRNTSRRQCARCSALIASHAEAGIETQPPTRCPMGSLRIASHAEARMKTDTLLNFTKPTTKQYELLLATH